MPLNKHHLYVYNEHGDFIQTIESSVAKRCKGVYNSDGETFTQVSSNTRSFSTPPRKSLSEHWRVNNIQRGHFSQYDSDAESDDSTGTTTSVQTRSQTRTLNRLTPRQLFNRKNELDSDWEPSDNEYEDPSYETESEDEFEELDQSYEEDNWYYDNYIRHR